MEKELNQGLPTLEDGWEYDDFIFKGSELKGMTRKGKDKVKLEGKTDMPVPKTAPDGTPITRIGENAFYRRGLTSVVIPETVISIGYDAFGVCKLTEVDIPDGVEEIEGFAFYRNKLKKVKFPASLKKIQPSAFAINELEHVDLPNQVELIETSSFYKNRLREVELPASLKKINMFAFHKNNIRKVKVGASVEVHSSAFEPNTKVERE